jgi:hypothetical protein
MDASDVQTVVGKRHGSSDQLTPLVPQESLIVPPEWRALDTAWQMRRGDKTTVSAARALAK